MFASMPVRGLSPGQLFDSLTQATGAEAAEARARFLELFANRDERSVEAETTIVQALTMMNGSYIDGATNPETSQVFGRDRQGPIPGHAGSDRNPLPRDPDPPPEARRAVAPGSIRRAAQDRRRPGKSTRGHLLGHPERARVPSEPLTRPVRVGAIERIRPVRLDSRPSGRKGSVAMSRPNRNVPQLTRRQVMRLAAVGALGASASGWIEALAADTAAHPNRRKSCILLWMSGGPSQTDTFDPKPGHANSGPFKPIKTAVPGMLLGPHLPKLARQAKDIAVIRSMSSKEGDHGRATYYLRTGYLPQGRSAIPTLGSLVANEFDDESAELPGFVSISPVRAINAAAFSSGFLGPKCAPLNVGERSLAGGADAGSPSLRVEDLEIPRGIGRSRADERLELMHTLGSDFLTNRPGVPSLSHQSAYVRAVKMMRSSAAKAFDLDRRTRRRARRVRPEPVRPGLPAGPPAWSSGASLSSR